MLHDLTIVEQPLGEHHPNKLHNRRHPVQWEDTRHQRCHHPRMVRLDDADPAKVVVLEEHDGIKKVA